MTRLIFAVTITIAIVIFAMANMHFVMLSFVVGPPLQMRLFFLLMIAFVAGIITAWFFLIINKIRAKRFHQKESMIREEVEELN